MRITTLDQGTDRERTRVEYADGSAYEIAIHDDGDGSVGWSVDAKNPELRPVDAEAASCATRAEAMTCARRAISYDRNVRR